MLARIIGIVSINSVVIINEENELITLIWSCTNSLAPKANGLLLSFKS